MDTYRLLVILHLLGASIWVGGHLVLSLIILPRALRRRDPAIVLEFESGYERLGMPALLVQVVTGVLLARQWAPDVAGWFAPATPQAELVAVKLGLLLATVLFAAHARLRLIPRLDCDRLPLLAAHVFAVTLLAVGFLVAGALLRTGGVM
jgi:putative copper export protein